jgi:hypothetical protein
MPLGEWAVSGLVIPFLAAFAVAALTRSRGAGWGGRLWSAWSALAIGLGYLAGHVAVARPAVPPLDVTDRVPWIVAVAIVLAIASTTGSGGPRRLWLVRGAIALVIVAALFEPVFSRWAQTPEGGLAMAATLVALVVGLGPLGTIGARGNGFTLGPAFVLTAVVAGAALGLTGGLTLGRLASALAAAAAGTWLVDRRSLGTAAALVFGSALGALLVEGWVYSGLPAWLAAILGLAPTALRWARVRTRVQAVPEAASV